MTAPWAAGYVGIPWRAKGRDRDGCDCWGLVRLVLAEQFGVEQPSYAPDYASPRERAEIATLLRGGIPTNGWLAADGPERPGDGVVFRLANAPWHVGVVVGLDEFLHVEEGFGAAAIDRLSASKWARRIVGIYRHERLA